MNARLDGKIAIITGAARGQGAEHGKRFVKEGARVVLADVLTDEVEQLATELGNSAISVSLDVTDYPGWERVLRTAESTFGCPDILVNNAGVIGAGRLVDISPDEFRHTIDVNLIGPWMGLRVVGSAMMRQGRGSIINISSMAGYRATPNRGGYTVSKWGVRGMSKAAALEFGGTGVRVNTILPGYIDTPILANRRERMHSEANWSGIGVQRLGEPADISAMAVFLASDESQYCTGADFVVDGGASLGYFIPLQDNR